MKLSNYLGYLTFSLIFVFYSLTIRAADDLMPPVRMEADGKPIDVGLDGGHAAAFVADIDGDGKKDLLVGVYNGNLRIYRNTGSNSKPVFKDFQLLKAGGADAKVPTG